MCVRVRACTSVCCYTAFGTLTFTLFIIINNYSFPQTDNNL